VFKHIIVFIFSFIYTGNTYGQILPSFYGVYANKKIPINGQVAFFYFTSGESGYTLSGASATSDKNGTANSAVELDDASDRITGEFSEILNNDFTVSLWAKLNNSYPSRKMWFIAFGQSINNKAFHFGSYFNSSNNGNYRVGSWGNNAGFTNDYLGNDTNWKHYVVTYDKSEEEYKFYINNQLTHTHTNHPLSIESSNFVIGSQLGYNESWYGKIDQLGVWNRILTSQEINNLFNNY